MQFKPVSPDSLAQTFIENWKKLNFLIDSLSQSNLLVAYRIYRLFFYFLVFYFTEK